MTRKQRILKNFLILAVYICILFLINGYLELNIWVTFAITFLPIFIIFGLAIAGIKQGLDTLEKTENKEY